jgi:hypothetical protein
MTLAGASVMARAMDCNRLRFDLPAKISESAQKLVPRWGHPGLGDGLHFGVPWLRNVPNAAAESP